MPQATEGIRLLTSDDVETWYQAKERRIVLGDVVDSRDGDTMSVGFAQYAPGESNEWVVTYDEALIVTRGSLTVTSASGRQTTATGGQAIFLTSGTKLTYSAGEHGATVVYVTYPHWIDAQRASEHAALIDTFQPVDGVPPRWGEAASADNVSLMKRIWGPLERGESDDYQPFFDALADEVVLKTSVGEVRGKKELIDYFVNASTTTEFHPFEKPLEYYGDGDRVVILGDETFKVRESGVTHRAEWAWVVDLHDGLITRILAIQDLSGVADTIEEAMAKARREERPAA